MDEGVKPGHLACQGHQGVNGSNLRQHYFNPAMQQLTFMLIAVLSFSSNLTVAAQWSTTSTWWQD